MSHAVSAGFEWSYPVRFIAACAALWFLRGSYKTFDRSLSWTGPIAEELAFRGFLLRRLVAEDFEAVPSGRFTWPALLLSSVAFGALHGSRWIAGTLAGLLYGLAMTRKGKLGDAIIAHAVTNAVLAVYVLLSNQWQLW